jgi:pimeloyl-ACP methyl ester carboxylesterase
MRAILPDLSGHGRSPAWPEPTPFTYRVDVVAIAQLLESLPEPAHLVGHSYGGLIALLATVAAPARVRSLALYDPVAFGVLDPIRDVEASRDLDRVRPDWDGSAEGRERWLTAFVDYWGGAGAWLALREDARDEFRRVAWVVFQEVTALVKDKTPASAYASFAGPVLLLGGERSPPAAHLVLDRLAGTFGDAKRATVAGAGHMGPLTHGDVVNGLILDALAGPIAR